MFFPVDGKATELRQQSFFVVQAAQVEVQHAVVHAPDERHRQAAEHPR